MTGMTRYIVMDGGNGRAMPDGPRSHPPGQALLRVLAADAVSIAIAALCVIYFGLQLTRAL